MYYSPAQTARIFLSAVGDSGGSKNTFHFSHPTFLSPTIGTKVPSNRTGWGREALPVLLTELIACVLSSPLYSFVTSGDERGGDSNPSHPFITWKN